MAENICDLEPRGNGRWNGNAKQLVDESTAPSVKQLFANFFYGVIYLFAAFLSPPCGEVLRQDPNALGDFLALSAVKLKLYHAVEKLWKTSLAAFSKNEVGDTLWRAK